MGTDTLEFDHEPGFWWVRVKEPIIENGGVSDEKWSEPVVARLEDSRWWLAGWDSPVVFEVDVLGPVVAWSGIRKSEPFESDWPHLPTPEAQSRVTGVLTKLIDEDRSFRSAVVLASYLRGKDDIHVAQGTGFSVKDASCSGDLVYLVRALRTTADQLEGLLAGKLPKELTFTAHTKGERH